MGRMLVVKPEAQASPFDLGAVGDLSEVRALVVLPGATVSNLSALRGATQLRELVLSSSAAGPADLHLLSSLPLLRRLHLNGMHLQDADLAGGAVGAPGLEELLLHRATGLTGAGVASVRQVTQLRLSETELAGVHDLAAATRLRRLEVTGVVLPDLRVLSAPALRDVDVDASAVDESLLADLVRDRRTLRSFHYPVREPEVLAGCTRLEGLTLHGGGPDGAGSQLPVLTALAHLPVQAVHVLCAASQERAEALLQHARAVWPGLVQTGYRQDW